MLHFSPHTFGSPLGANQPTSKIHMTAFGLVEALCSKQSIAYLEA